MSAEYAAWSADSKTFLLHQGDRAVFIGDSASSTSQRKLSLEDSVITPAISPSGALVAAEVLGSGDDHFEILQNSPGIAIYDSSTGRRLKLLRSDQGNKFGPFF